MGVIDDFSDLFEAKGSTKLLSGAASSLAVIGLLIVYGIGKTSLERDTAFNEKESIVALFPLMVVVTLLAILIKISKQI